jgi:hypothetical protein
MTAKPQDERSDSWGFRGMLAMIPEFDDQGYLPPGLHDAPLAEIAA